METVCQKAAIKSFAVWARKKLIEDIKQKAYEIGITCKEIREPEIAASDTMIIGNRTLGRAEIKQRKSLVSRIRDKGFADVIEEVAYTWFNRFIALRFMEVNGYLPTGVRVLSSIEPGKKEPDIIKEALNINLDLDRELVYRLQDANDTEALYRYLLVKQCNALNEILPGLFEEIEDYTEILLPSNLLAEGSVIRQLAECIPEEDFKGRVEIIGWMYQYYISEKKDEVFEGLKKNIKVTKENIPAATQLFTPAWIVRYMVENSLGRLWLEGHPNEELKSKWEYYLEEGEQEPEARKQLEEIRAKSRDIRPEDIKVLDPAMGSGHILVYAFDVLYDIYKSEGYSERDIPRLILENNLYGLDIDDRAAQLAYFAVMMKARSKSRRIFRERVNLNICAIQESNDFPGEAADYLRNLNYNTGETETGLEKRAHREDEEIEYLINTFCDAREYGSILEVKPIDFDAVERRLDEIRNGGIPDLFGYRYRNIILDKIPALVKQSRIMSQKYDVVITNPPYMGSKGINDKLKNYISHKFKDVKSDLFSVFIARNFNYAKPYGHLGYMTPFVWMFISSYEKLREVLIKEKHITSLVQLEYSGFDEATVPICTFTARNTYVPAKGEYIRLSDFRGVEMQPVKTLEAIRNPGVSYRYSVGAGNFMKIPGMPIAYWVSDKIIDCFNKGKPLGEIAEPRQGMATADNDRFLRLWHEVDYEKIGFNIPSGEIARESGCKWFPYNKGGAFRKWYGNNEYVVNWENDGREIRGYKPSVIRNPGYYFKKGITWSFVSSAYFGARYSDLGFIFDVGGSSVFPPEKYHLFLTGLLCSKISTILMKVLNPTLNFQVGNVAMLPVILPCDDKMARINFLVKENINLSRNDWDSFETSWNYRRHPFLAFKGDSATVEQTFNNWAAFAEKRFNRLKANEEELNRIFIDIYGLQDELVPGVEDKDITVRKADRIRDVKSFISYAVGCMFGRYSINADGFIYAGGNFGDKWKYENGQWKVRMIVKDEKDEDEEDREDKKDKKYKEDKEDREDEEGRAAGGVWVDATFEPDGDNVLPITDVEYFEDDITGRFIQFLKVTFGESKLEENLEYIAAVLGRKPSETARQAIRRYFLKDFYKDHVQLYQQRPVYWLFDSGRQDGFKALIYMHRYDEFTAAKVRTGCLHKLQKSYEAEIKRLDIIIESNASQREKTNARKKKKQVLGQLEECLQYDQVIAHVANQRIKIDFDDGVKVNHARFQDVEIPRGEGRKSLKADLLAKI